MNDLFALFVKKLEEYCNLAENEFQRNFLNNWAKENNCEFADYYIDDGFTVQILIDLHLIDLNDGIDTFCDASSNEITPFKAVFNDMYAKDISKKIRSVLAIEQLNKAEL